RRALPSFPTRRSSDLEQFVAAFRMHVELLAGPGDGGQHLLRRVETENGGAGAIHRQHAALRRLLDDALVDVVEDLAVLGLGLAQDRKSTRLNSSHVKI